MVDLEGFGPLDEFSARLQAISLSGWANIQTPVREALEASAATARRLAAELTASRDDVKRLEARLAGMEESFSKRLEGNASDMRAEVDNVRAAVEAAPRLADIQALVDEGCRDCLSETMEQVQAIEGEVAKVKKELRQGLESLRQATAGQVKLSDLEAYYPRAEAAARSDFLELENRVTKKTDKENVDAALATKVSWPELERMLGEKANITALNELEANCATSASLERVELGLARAVSMEEVRAFVETQTGDVQAMSPALERLLAARTREERESAEKGPGSCVTRSEITGLIKENVREMEKDDSDSAGRSARVSVSQVQAAISVGSESTLHAVDAQLARARGTQREEAVAQEKRLRGEIDDAIARIRGRVDGLDRDLNTAKAELVSLLNKKAYKTDVMLRMQGKAEARELEASLVLLRSKVDESEHKEVYSRFAHQLTALAAELSGARTELRAETERISAKLQTKADAEDTLAIRRSLADIKNTDSQRHHRPTLTATAASTSLITRGLEEGGEANRLNDPQQKPMHHGQQPAAQEQRTQPQPGAAPAEPSKARAQGPQTRPAPGGGFKSALSREEARILIRSELNRAGIGDKMTREEVLVLAETTATRARSEALQSLEATELRLRALDDRLDTSLGISSEANIRRLLEVQSTLEQRVIRSISLGRWLWNCSIGGAVSSSPSTDTVNRGILVPWNVQAVNACPECLVWEPRGTTVTAVVPGLYVLSCGFFSPGPFVATVFVNGSAVNSFANDRSRLESAVDPRQNEVADLLRGNLAPARPEGHSGTLIEKEDNTSKRYKHPAGEVLAKSAREFLALPEAAVVSVQFKARRTSKGAGALEGERLLSNGQGFLELQKL